MNLKHIYTRLGIPSRRSILVNSVIFFLTGLFLATELSLWTLPAKAFNFTTDAVRPADTLDFQALGYTYDTLPLPNLKIRKNATTLNADEKVRFINAVKVLKSTINSASDGTPISIYDQFVATHLGSFNVSSQLDPYIDPNPKSQKFANPGHMGYPFLPWHRELLHEFEQMLQVVDPDVTIPYWDYTREQATETRTIIFQDDFMGPNGTISANSAVQSGPFSAAEGWLQRKDLSGKIWIGKSTEMQPLKRMLGGDEKLPTIADVNAALARITYKDFTSSIERTVHNSLHSWVGSSLSSVATSPNDPMFWLLHSNVDRLWAQWQINGHWGNAWYPDRASSYGQALNDLMWPWDRGTVKAAPDLQALIPGRPVTQASNSTEFKVASTPDELLLEETNHLYNPFGEYQHDMDEPMNHEDKTVPVPISEQLDSA